MNKTKFYQLLTKAKNDDVSLILVISQIMPLINKYSTDKHNQLDEDLRSVLIEYAIKLFHCAAERIYLTLCKKLRKIKGTHNASVILGR